MATNGDKEQPISFEEFNQIARFNAPQPQYNRSMREYTLSLQINGVHGYGYSPNKDEALPVAIKSAYDHYLMAIELRNLKRRIEPIMARFEGYVRVRIGQEHGEITHCYFNLSTGAYYIDWNLATRHNGILIRECMTLYFEPETVTVDSLKTDFENWLSDKDLPFDRDKSILTARIEKLSKKWHDEITALPVIKPAQAKPGDVLVEKTRGHYFQVWKVSPSGSKIMVYRPLKIDLNRCENGRPAIQIGPYELERLDKDERQDDYYVMSWDVFMHHLTLGDKARTVKDKIYNHKKFGVGRKIG